MLYKAKGLGGFPKKKRESLTGAKNQKANLPATSSEKQI